jgi:hypothetical protein
MEREDGKEGFERNVSPVRTIDTTLSGREGHV